MQKKQIQALEPPLDPTTNSFGTNCCVETSECHIKNWCTPGKLTWRWKMESSLFVGNTSSNGPFSIAMLVYWSATAKKPPKSDLAKVNFWSVKLLGRLQPARCPSSE